MATLQVPTKLRNYNDKNFATQNLGTVNYTTDNMLLNPYRSYAMDVKVNKLLYKYVDKPPYIPSPLQQQMDARMEYSFDYNKSDEVNSYADVIMRTLVSVGDTMRGVKTLDQSFKQFGTDTYNLLYRGTVQPFMNKDWSVLFANNFVNFRETVDLVDNIWKGFAIGGELSLLDGGNFDWNKAKDGVRRAVVDRENFDFDTGNKVMDTFLEMATPTNIALLGGSMLAGSIGKAALKESGETVSKSLAKDFAKKYTGELGSTFTTMGKNLTAGQIKSLTEVSKHVKNLQLLAGVNKIRKVVDIADSVGPMMAWRGTVGVPWSIIKATTGASEHAVRYFATAVDNVQAGNPAPSVISTLIKRPDYELLIENMGTASRIANEKPIVIAFDDILSGAANIDNNKLKRIYKDFYKTFDNKTLVENYVKEIYQDTGKFTAFEVAQKAMQEKTLAQLTDTLNQFTIDATGKIYKTFDEYSNVIKSLYELSDRSAGIEALHKTVSNLENQFHVLFAQDLVQEVDAVIRAVGASMKQVNDTKLSMKSANYSELQELISNVTKATDAKDNLGIVGAPERLTKYRQRLFEIFDELKGYKNLKSVEEFTKEANLEIKRYEDLRTKGYSAFKKASKATGDTTPFNSQLLDSKIAALEKAITQNRRDNITKSALMKQHEAMKVLVNEAYNTPKEFARLDNVIDTTQKQLTTFKMDAIPFGNIGYETTKISASEPIKLLVDYSEALEKYVVLGEQLSDAKLDMIQKVQDYIEESINLLHDGATKANVTIATAGFNSIEKYGQEYFTALGDIATKLEQLPVALLRNETFGAGLQTLTKSMYGKEVLHFANETLDKLEAQFGKNITSSLEDQIKQTFYIGKEIDQAMYAGFLEKLDKTIAEFTDESFIWLGEMQSDSQTFAVVTEELAFKVDTFKGVLEKLKEEFALDPTKINHTTLGDTLDELSTVKYYVEQTIKKLQPNLDRGLQFNFDPKYVSSITADMQLITDPTVEGVQAALSKSGVWDASDSVWHVLKNGVSQEMDEHVKAYVTLKNKGGIMDALDLAILQGTPDLIKGVYVWDQFVLKAKEAFDTVNNAYYTQNMIEQFKKTKEAIQDIEQTIGYTADIEIGWTKDIMKSYTLKFNATLRNLHLLQNEELIDLLENVKAKNYAEMPVLESLEAMSRYNVDGIKEFQNILATHDLNEITKVYYEMFHKAFNPSVDSVSQLNESINTIFEVQQSAQIMMDTLHGMVSVTEFYDSVQAAVDFGLDKDVANSFLDAIQRTYDNPASLVALADLKDKPWMLQYEYNKVIDNMDMQLRNKSSKYKFTLEDWHSWIENSGQLSPEDSAEYTKYFGTKRMSHTAPADAYAEYIVHKYILQDNVAKNKYFYIDIEGNGLSTSTTSLYQKSIVDPEHGIYKWYINTGVEDINLPQEDGIYHLLFGDDKERLETLGDLKENFRKIYQNKDKKEAEHTLREYFDIKDSPIEIIMVDNEAELLKQSNEFIQSQKPPEGKLIYRMHNGWQYDAPLLNNRARYLGVDNYNINLNRVEDTKVLLEEFKGVRGVTSNERATIEDLIYKHIVRRNSELSAFGAERMVDTKDVKLNENLSKFLPSMDHSFTNAYEKIIKVFEEPTANREFVEETLGVRELFKDLTTNVQLVYDDLADLERMNKRLARFRMFVNENDLTAGNRLLPANYADGVPEELLANHIGMDLAKVNMVDGVYVPIIGVNKHSFPNVVAEYFNTGHRKVSDRNMKQMTELAGSIQRTMSYIRNPHAIDALNVYSLYNLHQLLLTELRGMVGNNYFNPIMGDLVTGDTPLRAFATTYELFKMYEKVANGTIAQIVTDSGVYRYPLVDELLKNEEFSEIVMHMVNTKELFKNSLSEYGADKLFYSLDPPPGETKLIYEYWGKLSKNSLLTLRDLEDTQDMLQFTRLKRVASVYRGMGDSFDSFNDVAVNTVTHVNKLLTEGTIKDAPANVEPATYSTLRSMSEAYDSIISYNKLEQVVTSTPEQLASYLRHQGKGVIAFKNTSLESKNYFPRRGLTKMKDVLDRNMLASYKALTAKQNELANLGIGLQITKNETILYINDFTKIADAKYVPMLEDFDMTEWIDIIVNSALDSKVSGEVGGFMRDANLDGIYKAMHEVDGSRQQLTKLAMDGKTSTLEILDEIAMENVLGSLKEFMPDGMDVLTMQRHGMFDGNYFNHSILGHIDGRRTYMNYSSFNPAKTMYHATEMVEKHLGAQVQLLELVQIPEFKLENFIGNGKMQVDEVITYLKQAPHLKLAFLNDKSTKEMGNFKLSAITVNSPKDIEFALKMGAVVLDSNTYNAAYKIINNYKIRNGVADFLDKAIVAPFKLGWLAWNYGVVARNIVDTSLKNAATTKDMNIIPAMAQMTGDYFTYKTLLTEIYRYADQQQVHIDVAVNEYFAKNAKDISIPRETFDLITEYQKAGGEVSMAEEVLEHYGDSIDRMYKKVDEEHSGLSKTDFREMMTMPDDVARQWLTEKFPDNLSKVDVLMETKGDLLTYKRAYAMHKAYKGSDLSVDQLVTYLKTGRIEPGHEEVLQELMDKTTKVTADGTLFNKIMTNPLIANSLEWNMASEEILRLSMFKHLRDTGYNTVQTMAEIARTHFDYGKKHWMQMYMEMIMPFSTFRVMSLIYWVEEFSKNAQGIEMLADSWAALSQLSDRTPEDALLRRNLRYQMYTGNLILNNETGLTAKINPTPMDMMSFFMNPVEYVTESFHSGGQALVDLMNATPYENEKELDFYKRKKTMALNMVPFFGSQINKIRQSADKAKDENDVFMPEKFILNLILSPLFNTTWTPEQGGEWKRYGEYKPKQYMPYKGYANYRKYQNYRPSKKYSYKRYPKKFYPKRVYDKKQYPKYSRTFQYGYKDWSKYSPYNRTMNMPQFKFKRGSAYPTKASRSLNTAFASVWRLSMTKKGNAKYKFMGFPTNKWTLKIKIQMLRNITSYNRWA